jgi:hypothetical protein
MKSFLRNRYHLMLLGIAVLVALASAGYLTLHSRDFEDSFKNSPLNAKSSPFTASSTTSSYNALELLKKKIDWKPREDGASPYISRPYLLKDGKLVDPMEGNEPLYPPVPNEWLISHHLDYTDMKILERDPKHKGFTVREEYEAGTDPNNPAEFPPLCSKLSFDESGIRKTTYILEFLGSEENDTGKKELRIRPSTPLPNPDKGGRLDTSSRPVAVGSSIPGAPFLTVKDYQEKKKTIKETEYDVSELSLLNTLTGENYVLVKKNVSPEYKKTPIELIDSITFTYQLSGVPAETIMVERGKEFPLTSLDKSYSETYKLKDLSKDGVLLEKDGKSFQIKPASQATQSSLPAPSITP